MQTAPATGLAIRCHNRPPMRSSDRTWQHIASDDRRKSPNLKLYPRPTMSNQPAADAPTSVLRHRVHLPWLIASLLGGLCIDPGPLSAEESRIELRDGSVIGGEVIGVGDGVYRVRSASLGEIQVRESDVLAIRPGGSGTTAAPATDSGNQDGALAAVQQQLLGNPQTMDAISRLQGDAEVTAVLTDPEFMRLITAGDVEKLRTDPRFRRLMENPSIQAIVEQVLGK